MYIYSWTITHARNFCSTTDRSNTFIRHCQSIPKYKNLKPEQIFPSATIFITLYILIIWNEDSTTFYFTKLLQKYSFRHPLFFFFTMHKQRQSQTPSHTASDFTADRDIRGLTSHQQQLAAVATGCGGCGGGGGGGGRFSLTTVTGQVAWLATYVLTLPIRTLHIYIKQQINQIKQIPHRVIQLTFRLCTSTLDVEAD